MAFGCRLPDHAVTMRPGMRTKLCDAIGRYGPHCVSRLRAAVSERCHGAGTPSYKLQYNQQTL